MGNGTDPCGTPLAFFAPHRGMPKRAGRPVPPRIPQIQRDAGRALHPRVVPAVAARAIAERRERTSGQQRERKMAPATSTVRSAGEGRGDGGAPANQLGAACSSRRRPGKGATCSVAHPRRRGPLLRRTSSMAWR
jgi:hypothetical protein